MAEQDFQASLENFVDRLQNMVNIYWDDLLAKYNNSVDDLPYPVIAYSKITPRTRYVRITKSDSGSKSAHCFIDIKNGDVLKPAGWKSPALPHARGNIYSETHGMEGVNPHGANYIGATVWVINPTPAFRLI